MRPTDEAGWKRGPNQRLRGEFIADAETDWRKRTARR
jgi:hypothetical protein